jgi:hypothetical protein
MVNQLVMKLAVSQGTLYSHDSILGQMSEPSAMDLFTIT